jgi:polygalacturonase
MQTNHLVLALLFRAAGAEGAVWNVRDYGATGDGKTKYTAAIAKTIAAAEKAGGGTAPLRR